jgi:unsaturated chondroitin disaccharide hydrolase
VSHTPSSHIDLQAVLADSLERLCRHHQVLGNLFPTVGEGIRYQLTENDNWLSGFWTGLLWLAYVATGDERLRAHAEALLPSFEERLDKWVHITHDLISLHPQC